MLFTRIAVTCCVGVVRRGGCQRYLSCGGGAGAVAMAVGFECKTHGMVSYTFSCMFDKIDSRGQI